MHVYTGAKRVRGLKFRSPPRRRGAASPKLTQFLTFPRVRIDPAGRLRFLSESNETIYSPPIVAAVVIKQIQQK